ncbi:hypothetical protein ALC56_09304 [Trachymyrmex septentrionalis]|uniref:Secreted protein n=1 Tax=Trachymyrmex septentrionalis TaxID=34720 RepID=A0A195F8F9_9HYME|nr:PREDICTED: uncharacterized protein LOC108750964 [Trachymyrmex septentrionalis]KYN36344.1 hypothetical protein ALC56_09304 [Trachymyrmex septentrionalis]
MTPTFCWIFLLVLALVGRATSVPRPITVDACALLCNPGAETESERERDVRLFPRYPKVNCKLQSLSDEHQTFAIMGHCLKLCAYELTIASEVNCFALRSSLQASIGCYCDALMPLSPNTMRLHETWRLNFLVKELAKDIMTTILKSPLDVIILCEIREELFKNANILSGELYTKCINPESSNSDDSLGRTKRNIEESETDKFDDIDDGSVKLVETVQKDENIESVRSEEVISHRDPRSENLDLSREQTAEGSSHQDQDNPTLGEHSENNPNCQTIDCKPHCLQHAEMCDN